MEHLSKSPIEPRMQPVAGFTTPAADGQLHALSSMLQNLEEVAATPKGRANEAHENHLVHVRLGVASALFSALRAKHPASAAHSLRVALGCSAWGLTMELSDVDRDEIEAAALLHDIGKIGVPDYVLLKPGALEADERELMQRHHSVGLEILSACSNSQNLLDIVRYAPRWYRGDNDPSERSGKHLPLGSRMLAIVNAFDSMTSDHVWRRAMSRDRAMAELCQHAGTQFDPDLVRDYCILQSNNLSQLQGEVARRWLRQLNSSQSNGWWSLQQNAAPAPVAPRDEALYFEAFVGNMHDAVIFVDNSLRILLWNNGAERLTGLSSESVLGRRWSPKLIELLNDRGLVIPDDQCPVAGAIYSGLQMIRRYTITGRNGQEVSVNTQIMPVITTLGTTKGAAVLLHDVSSETTLEEQIQSLSQRATTDPLTKVANRAELDRMHTKFVDTHLKRGLPCALVLCDIDHFKNINDTYGHQAGDEALVSFAALLKRSCRPGDLVARYGGEEFALLCADCDNATAASRADKIRIELASTAQTALGGHAMTASFGVTEIQSGDTPETMVRRADRALYQAKEMGRNMVVQLGAGLAGEAPAPRVSWWQSWFARSEPDALVEAQLVATVPLKMVAEKLRGFVADQEAAITAIDENHVILTLDGSAMPLLRRSNDRSVPFLIEMNFTEKQTRGDASKRGGSIRTQIHVIIRPKRSRDRRRRDSVERARQVLSSLKSYLMAQEFVDEENLDRLSDKQQELLDVARAALAPWLTGDQLVEERRGKAEEGSGGEPNNPVQRPSN